MNDTTEPIKQSIIEAQKHIREFLDAIELCENHIKDAQNELKRRMDNKTYACRDCKHYKNHRCKLWEVKISKPDNSHCESFQNK